MNLMEKKNKITEFFDNKIEELKQMHLVEYYIQEPCFRDIMRPFDVETLSLKDLQKMIYLYEYREEHPAVFGMLNDIYDNLDVDENLIQKRWVSRIPKELDFEEIMKRCTKRLIEIKKVQNQVDIEVSAFNDAVAAASPYMTDKKSRKKALKNLKSESKGTMTTYKYYTLIQEYYKELQQRERQYQSDIKKLTNHLKKVKNIILELPKYQNLDDIDFALLNEIDKDLNGIIDEKIYEIIFKSILEYQKERYDRYKLAKESLDQTEKQDTLRRMFSRFNIDFEGFDQDIKDYLYQLEDLNSFYDKMKSIGISKSTELTLDYIKMIQDISTKMIDSFKYLISHNLISTETFAKRLPEYQENEKRVLENSKIMLERRLNYSNNLYNEEILFNDPNKVEKTDKLLSSYRENITSADYNYFKDESNFDLLDILIENEIDIYCFDSYLLSKEDIKNLNKRLQICTMLDIDVYSEKGNLNRTFLLGNGFYCKEEELDEYLTNSKYIDQNIIEELEQVSRTEIDKTITSLPEVIALEEYVSDDNSCYNINGLIISRNKVLRNLTYFKNNNKLNENTIINSIFYNMNVNDEEVLKVKSIISKESVKN